MTSVVSKEEVQSDIIVSLEEPVNGEIHSGIGNLRGYAFVGGSGRIEIYIDGKYAFGPPYGGSRADVGNAFPQDDSFSHGFSLAYGFANLDFGQHTMTARAVTEMGDSQDSSSTFTGLAFQKRFIFSSDIVYMPPGNVSAGGDEIFIENILVDGEIYDSKLKRRTATQGFEMIELRQ